MRTTGKLKIDYGVDWMKEVSKYFLDKYDVNMFFEHGRGDQDVLHIYARFVTFDMGISCKIFGGELWDLIKLASIDALTLAIEREIGYNLTAISEANSLIAPAIKNLRKITVPIGCEVNYSFVTGNRPWDTLFISLICDGLHVEKNIPLLEFRQTNLPVDYVLMTNLDMSISDLIGTFSTIHLK